ncbi:BAM_G0043580.mRNA.1.CDS.1 [Saccharomyces cerevisiae]|nr:BAM_G0043580.mRNA.1.CDS.1 [Saccharomyces cerevisiae]CAI7287736.1 BAM_G0043580.mRNA.1.CDS.1 [Saccharomyces cerevisiae]
MLLWLHHLASVETFQHNVYLPLRFHSCPVLGTSICLLFVDLSRKASPYRKQLIHSILRIGKFVAANLNSVTPENKAWNTKYFFSARSVAKKRSGTTLLEPVSSQRRSCQVTLIPGFRPLTWKEALGVYFTEVERQWKLFNSENPWSPVGLEDAKLPKEAYRFKLTWVHNRHFPIFMLIPFLNFVLHICVTGNVPSICAHLSRVDSFQGWYQVSQNMRMIVLSVKMEQDAVLVDYYK